MQQRYAIHICNRDMQYHMLYDRRSSGAGRGRHTIVSDIPPYRTAECVYRTCTGTTKLKLAVGALCWDNLLSLSLAFPRFLVFKIPFKNIPRYFNIPLDFGRWN